MALAYSHLIGSDLHPDRAEVSEQFANTRKQVVRARSQLVDLNRQHDRAQVLPAVFVLVGEEGRSPGARYPAPMPTTCTHPARRRDDDRSGAPCASG